MVHFTFTFTLFCLDILKMKQYVTVKCCNTSARLHGAITQNTTIRNLKSDLNKGWLERVVIKLSLVWCNTDDFRRASYYMECKFYECSTKKSIFPNNFSLQAKAGVVPEIGHDRFLPYPFQLNIHYPKM